MALTLAILGALLLAAGAALIYLPAGLIVAGTTCIAAAYIRKYLEAASGEVPGRSRTTQG